MSLRVRSVCAVAMLGFVLALPFATVGAAASQTAEAPAAKEDAAALAVAIEGVWYVLIHYTDDHSGDPKRWHWEDHVWVIHQRDARLHWRDYPIVVFDDQEGRFERVGNNPLARTTGAWEPNPGQREQIRMGLKVNDRGLRTKTLYPGKGEAPARGEGTLLWATPEAARPQSASVITFSSTWQVTAADGLPVFSWDDALSSARTESMEGRTEFRVEEIDAEGVMHGRFERDGVRHGRFRLYSTAGPGDVDTKKRGLFR